VDLINPVSNRKQGKKQGTKKGVSALGLRWPGRRHHPHHDQQHQRTSNVWISSILQTRGNAQADDSAQNKKSVGGICDVQAATIPTTTNSTSFDKCVDLTNPVSRKKGTGSSMKEWMFPCMHQWYTLQETATLRALPRCPPPTAATRVRELL
jgi:hypothetical protein